MPNSGSGRLSIVLLPAILLVGYGAQAWRHQLATASSITAQQLIDQPEAWVAFEADVTISHPGQPPVVGRYYRSVSGSFRLQTGATLKDIRVVSIKNTIDGVWYVYSKAKERWTRHQDVQAMPIDHPPMRIKRGFGLQPYQFRLALRPGESPNYRATVGLTAYQRSDPTDPDGTYNLYVPELNMFPVLAQEGVNGRREAYTNIDLKEPAIELFYPPPGVPVEEGAPIGPPPKRNP